MSLHTTEEGGTQHGGDDVGSYLTDVGCAQAPYREEASGPFLTQGLGTGAGYAFLDTTPHRRAPPEPKPWHPRRQPPDLVPQPPPRDSRVQGRTSVHRVSLATGVSESQLTDGSGDVDDDEPQLKESGDHAPLYIKRWHGGEDVVTDPRCPLHPLTCMPQQMNAMYTHIALSHDGTD